MLQFFALYTQCTMLYKLNELISNLIPATGLKIVGTGAYLPWCSISFSFQNSLKTSGHRVYGFLVSKFGPILAWYRFPAAEEMRQMFSFGETSGLQAGQFSSRTLWLQNHAVVIAAVCGFALSCWNTCHLYIPFSIHSALQNMQVAHTVCIHATPYNQRCWLLNWTLMTHWKVSLLFSPEDMVSMITNKNVKFGLVWP